ncbi:vWA domain-containing protein [Tuwongella immobilis]|uniref:von willebrand factor type a: Uncharacterized protein n=1 Tax=Tuwongella immobilis TaxID=692036 RepID=A0A6C2YR99_9BACT|nr:hypothetical protein [Tuwongella immobilis]VIP03633.1 von willebrand factor type a : Uncharacterized protein OS=Plesiocystis pacifica SIR-1 GN=PPSIR1_40390 PE=4 SV=1 [Tuwongella immobilis]VTS04634.1 von willebrand factor type a : Uncharacterized protein OS=Plesiocystis pacifica SIR-1 GN=PPSIR1_40390 PE=4 SV=1 [Tuwongella immobilis]
MADLRLWELLTTLRPRFGSIAVARRDLISAFPNTDSFQTMNSSSFGESTSTSKDRPRPSFASRSRAVGPRLDSNQPKRPKSATPVNPDDGDFELDLGPADATRRPSFFFDSHDFRPMEPEPIPELSDPEAELVRRLTAMHRQPVADRTPYLGFLKSWVRHRNPIMRRACLPMLAGACGYLAIETLADALDDADESVQLVAAETLARSCSAESWGGHLLVLMHRNPAIRRLAAQTFLNQYESIPSVLYLLADSATHEIVVKSVKPAAVIAELPLMLAFVAHGTLPAETLVRWIVESPVSVLLTAMAKHENRLRSLADANAILDWLKDRKSLEAGPISQPLELGEAFWRLILRHWSTTPPIPGEDRWLIQLTEELDAATPRLRQALLASLVAVAAEWDWATEPPADPSRFGRLYPVGIVLAFAPELLTHGTWNREVIRHGLRLLHRLGDRFRNAEPDEWAKLLSIPALRDSEGHLDLAILAGLLRLGKKGCLYRIFSEFGKDSIQSAIERDSENAVLFLSSLEAHRDDLKMLIRRLGTRQLADHSAILAQLMLSMPGDRLEWIEILDSEQAVASFAAILRLEHDFVAPTLNKRRRLGELLFVQIGPSHILKAMREWLNRDQPEESPTGLMLWTIFTQHGSMAQLRLTLRGLDPSQLRRLLRSFAFCTGISFDREYEIAQMLSASTDVDVQAWVKSRLQPVGSESSTPATKPIRGRIGICQELATSDRTIYPDVEVILALVGSHDPLHQVCQWVEMYSESSERFRKLVEAAAVMVFRGESELSVLGHALLYRWEFHRDCFMQGIAALGVIAPLDAIRWMASLPSPFLQRYVWLALIAAWEQQLARGGLTRVDWWTEAYLNACIEQLATPIGELVALHLKRIWQDRQGQQSLLMSIAAIQRLWASLSVETRANLGFVSPPSDVDAESTRADETANQEWQALPFAEKIANLFKPGWKSEWVDWFFFDQRTPANLEALLAASVGRKLTWELSNALVRDVWVWTDLPTERLEFWASRPGIPLALESALCWALAESGEQRFPDMFDRILQRFQEGTDSTDIGLLALGMFAASRNLPVTQLVDWVCRLPAKAPQDAATWALDCIQTGEPLEIRLRLNRILLECDCVAVIHRVVEFLLDHEVSEGYQLAPFERALQRLNAADDPLQIRLANWLYARDYSHWFIPMLLPIDLPEQSRAALLRQVSGSIVRNTIRSLTMLGTDAAFENAKSYLEELEATDYARSDGYMQLVETCEDVDIRKEAIRQTQHMRWREPKLERMARTFAWGVREGRKLTGRLFTIQMLMDNNLGYTRLNEDKIYISPLPLLRYVWNGEAIVRGLIVHEYGHHLYHRGEVPQAIWKDAHDEGIGQLLNLVSDEQLERNLRALDSTYGDDLKKLGAYAFQHSQRSIDGRELLESLGVHAFAVLSQSTLVPDRSLIRIGVNNGQILMAMEQAGMSFPKFMRCLRMGKPNRDGDPRVEAGLKLFRGKFRHSTMTQMREIARELRRIFGHETDLLKQFSMDVSLSSREIELDQVLDGITDKDLQSRVIAELEGKGRKRGRNGDPKGRPSISINLSEEEKFDTIDKIQPMPHDPEEHKRYADRVARPARQMREFLSNLGLNMVPQKMRIQGKMIDRSRLRNAVLRSDPRLLISRKIQMTTDLFLGVIVDCSGSMTWNENIEKAKLFGTLLAEAAKGQAGIDVRLFGFTDQVIYDAGNANRCGIHGLYADDGNNDSAALWHVAQIAQQSNRRAKLLVMISDGSPTECSVESLKALVTQLSRKQFCCAQVAVRELDHVCFPNYIVLDEANLDKGVREFGKIVAKLVKKALGHC